MNDLYISFSLHTNINYNEWYFLCMNKIEQKFIVYHMQMRAIDIAVSTFLRFNEKRPRMYIEI